MRVTEGMMRWNSIFMAFLPGLLLASAFAQALQKETANDFTTVDSIVEKSVAEGTFPEPC